MITVFLVAVICIMLWGVSITYSTTPTAARARIARNAIHNNRCRFCGATATGRKRGRVNPDRNVVYYWFVCDEHFEASS